MIPSRRVKLLLAIASWAVAAIACNAIVGNSDVQLGDDGGGGGGGTGGGGGAAGGGGTAGGGGGVHGADAGDGGGVDSGVAPTYSDLANGANWSGFDISALTGVRNGFVGGAFDGQYVYLSPGNNGIVVRYDTHASFSAAASYATFDTGTLDPGGFDFAGAVFDGRFVYFVPDNSNTFDGAIEPCVLVRFDTQGAKGFQDSSSWASLDLTSLDTKAVGYAGGAFDGTFIYFVQHEDNAKGVDGLYLRYQTTAPFDASSSYLTFNVPPVDTSVSEFDGFGAVFDGRYVYYAHHDYARGVLLQFDTHGDYADAGSWVPFDERGLEPPDGGGNAYTGAAFDGKKVYFVPNGSGVPASLALQYNPAAGAFGSSSAWSTFAPTSIDSRATGFQGAAFDGKYVYLVPNNNGAANDGVVARFDTTATFGAGTSWQTYDITAAPAVGANGVGFFGAVFDGEYVYFVPNAASTLVRFDAKTPPSMPVLYSGGPAFYGSFL